MICNKHIEIHMELVNKIQSLKNEYKKRKESNKQRYIQAYKNDDRETLDYGMGYERALNEILEDLEELLK